MRYAQPSEARRTGARENPARSRFWRIILLEILILAVGALAILSGGGVEYAFEGDGIILNTDGVESAGGRLEETPEGTHFFISPSVSLPRGIYQICVEYSADAENNRCEIVASGEGAYPVYSDQVVLSPNQKVVTYDIWANGRLDSMRVRVSYANSGYLQVDRIAVKTAWNSALYRLAQLAAVLLLVGFVCYLCLYWDFLRMDKVVLLGILGTTALASCGLFGEYYTQGHDIAYHLTRIEGLKDALLAGQIPARIQPNWLNGWGYAVSVVDGDLTILLPALLRMLGLTVQDAYKGFVLFTNLATALIAYHCFKKMSASKYTGLVCSVLYTLSVYRMCCIYVLASVQEYAAMMFLPLVALGLYDAFVDEPSPAENGKLLAPILGLTGLLQTHLLTLKMTAIFMLLIAIFGFKKLLNRHVRLYLVKVAAGFVLVNLWFLIPMAQYMREDLVAVGAAFGGRIQARGLTLAELLMPVYNGNVAGTHGDGIIGLGAKFPIALGSAFLIVLALYLIVSGKWGKGAASVVFALAGLSVFMATNLFPYDAIASRSQALSRLVATGQFPYRYLAISGLLCSALACFIFAELKNRWDIGNVRILAAALCVVAALQGTSYVYKVLFTQEMSFQYDGAGLRTDNVLDGGYLYRNTYASIAAAQSEPKEYNAQILSYDKRGTDVTLDVQVTGPNASIRLPMLYYIGYAAYDVDTHERFDVYRAMDDNNRLGFKLPEGYQGTVAVRFAGKWYWKLADAVSLLSAALLIFAARKPGLRFKLRAWMRRAACLLRGLGEKAQRLREERGARRAARLAARKAQPARAQHSKAILAGNLIVTAAAFAMVLVLNFHMEYTSDDFHYHFFFDTMSNPPADTVRFSPLQVFSSMANHWRLCNARIVAHGLLQIVLTFGKPGFKIFNSLMYILLGTLIYQHATYGKRKSVSLLALIYACMWFFLPQFGATVLWASGAANYLWMAALIMGFLLLYRVYLVRPEKIRNTTLNAVLIGLLGVMAGCTNEKQRRRRRARVPHVHRPVSGQRAARA